MIGFCPLGSGSKGNSCFFGSERTKVLIDAGLSGRATDQRLQQIGQSLDDIQGILITHDHHDHIAGLKQLAIRRGIPVYANAETAKGIVAALEGEVPKLRIFQTGEAFEVGDLEILPMPILHDTVDPVAFVIQSCSRRVGICTDLGMVTPAVLRHLQNCDHLVLEANHEPDLVAMSARPLVYKQRVLGRYGHLSNQAARELLQSIWHAQLRSVHFAHLSSECNRPELALQAGLEAQKRSDGALAIHIAHQDRPSEAILF
jgi:phosphoribosyl 1,2-cyclic phosphodiesterase